MEPTQQGSLPFLDTLVTIEQENTFSTLVYRKSTHTDQYLHWDSNHHITANQSVFNTLAHRAKVVSSSQEKLEQELKHIKTALQTCQFPNWALNQWDKFTNQNQPTNSNNTNNNNQQDNNPNKKNITIVVPFIPGTSEKFRKLCKIREYKYIIRAPTPSRHYSGTPKTRIPNSIKQGLSTITSAPK